ncbi:hypothetical protein UFOVP253_26 [uncultured Caudovirales phage]|uniref:Uncharacterized protein n=1 Tax=uncultured Caudovirales phage TaxID=2100421 RepID=A0A6J5LHR5_9CAUD|nr:hypothetical protein UFOVP253_26 [uncultured Caudovirales phage]
MAYLQSDIDNIVNGIVNRFTGQRIAFPNGNYPGECTAPIVWYLTNMGVPIPYMYGDRADGWGVQFPAELAPYFTHEAFQPGKAYPRGTILMWNSPHIAIVLADSGGDNSVLCFEQNADPDGAPCGIHNRTLNTSGRTCTYALIPILDTPVQTPPAPLYTVTETYPQGKQVQLNKQPTNKWGMNWHFDYMSQHPVEVHNQGEILTMDNKVHHEDGYDYYRCADDVDGFNVLDCDDYTPPYVLPAAPLVPKLAQTIQLNTTVDVYGSAADADNRNKDKRVGTFPALNIDGKQIDYYLFSTAATGMQEIGITNQTKVTVWMNPKDNVAPPMPEVKAAEVVTPAPIVPTVTHPAPQADAPWFNKIAWLNADMLPEIFLPTRDVQVSDWSGNRPEVYTLPQYDHAGAITEIRVYGTITNVNGTKYYLVKLPSDTEFNYRFAIPMVDPDTGRALLLKKHVKVVRNRDQLRLAASEIEKLGLQFIDSILPPKWFKKK